jgi:hypothetical protein
MLFATVINWHTEERNSTLLASCYKPVFTFFSQENKTGNFTITDEFLFLSLVVK